MGRNIGTTKMQQLLDKLALGCVQLGLDYGVTNSTGKVSYKNAESLIQIAFENGIKTLDTAKDYGNSEEVLGQIGVTSFNIVTKLTVPQNIKPIEYADFIMQSCMSSLRKLRVDSVYGVLLHNPQALTNGNYYEVLEGLHELKVAGLTQKIGLSIYSSEDLYFHDELLDIDLVQAPLNALDKRLSDDGTKTKLQEKNIELHTRSVFLQGLLLLAENDWPANLSKFSNEHKRWLNHLERKGGSAMAACLSYPLLMKEVSKIAVGVQNGHQLMEIINTAKSISEDLTLGFKGSELTDLINPSKWSNQ